jgi:ribonuclease I
MGVTSLKLYQSPVLRRVQLCLLALLVSVISPGAGAVSRVDYDYYTLALSLAPAFCESRPEARQCVLLDAARFRAQPLTLHGLWPSRHAGRHPANCGGARSGGYFCALPEVSLSPALQRALDTAMPGRADCLDRHEWGKHGSCSGLSPADYFSASLALQSRVNAVLGPLLARHAGSVVEIGWLLEQLARKDAALAQSLVFNCRTPRTRNPAKRRPLLVEVKTYWAVGPDGRPGRPLAREVSGARHANSGCPGGRAPIDMP